MKPDSAEAPKPNNDNKTDSQTDGKTDTDTKADDKPKEDEKPKEEESGLCKLFPNILACDTQPEAEEPNLEVPKEEIPLSFEMDHTFSEYGQCPAPVQFQALGGTYAFSLEPACTMAEMMRPFIIAMAWLVASFFVARVVRENA